MAVSEQTPYIEHTGNGVTTSFSLGFQCESKDHLIVLVDEIEPPIATWSLTGGNVVFTTAPAAGKKIKLQRNTPFGRTTNYQSFNNSFRPQTVNIDFDRIWWKLQELGVADWLMKLYVDRLHQQQEQKINDLKGYVDDRDDELRAYLMEEIRKQGVALDQLDEYYNYLMQRLAQIAVDKGWAASFIVDASGENQQEINDRFKSKLQGEFISVWDFFTKSEKQAYNFALIKGTAATYDSYRQLKEFFDYIAANDVGTAYCNGTFYTSKGILFGGAAGSKTKKILGEFNLCAIAGNPIPTLFTMQTGSQFAWLGRVHVQGVGGIWYAQRTVQVGLLIGGQYSARDTYITQIDADGGFKEYGVVLGNNTTGSHLDSVRTTRCGSGLAQSGYSLTTSFNLISEDLAAGPSQRSVLQCAVLPPEASTDISPMLYIDGNLHIVISIDTSANEVTVFPIISRGLTSGDARWVFGAGLATSGGDASVSRVGKLTGTANGITYASGSLYPVQMGALTSEANFIGATLGRSPSSAHVGGSIQSFYCENQTFDLVRRTRAAINFTITSEYAMNLDRFFDLTAARSPASGDVSWATGAYFDGVFLVYRGYPLSFCGRPAGINEGSVLVTNPVSDRTVVQYRSSYAFTLTAPNDSISKTFGRTGTSCIVINPDASNGAPSGAIVFNAPAGYTVNGQNSVSFSGFVSAARFEVYWTGGTDIVVVPLTLMPSQTSLSASVTYDPESLAVNEIKYWNVTLNGAKLGDAVVCSFSRALNGTRIWAEVTGANIVTVYHQNPTATPVDIGTGTLRVKLI